MEREETTRKGLTRYPEHREFNVRLDKMEDRIRTTYRKFLNDHNESTPSRLHSKTCWILRFRRTERTDAEEVNLLSWKATGNESDPFIYRGYLTKYIEELAVRHNHRDWSTHRKNTIRNTDPSGSAYAHLLQTPVTGKQNRIFGSEPRLLYGPNEVFNGSPQTYPERHRDPY